jgi:phosphotransferase system enzyme I (PtsI)
MVNQATPVSPGIAIGPALLFDASELKIIRSTVRKSEIEAEIEKFRQAVDQAKHRVGKVKKEVLEKLGEEHAKIFDAHTLILEDQTIIERTLEEITQNHKNAGYAFDDTMLDVLKKLQGVSDEYLKDRIADVRDVRSRVLHILFGSQQYTLADLRNPAVVVARELTPSDTAQMNKDMILGVITEIGGKTSHAAIISRALEIPSVVGVHQATQLIPSGANLVVDGNTGEVLVNPDKPTLRKWQAAKRKYYYFEKRLLKYVDKPALTKDGREIKILANIELPFEIDTALQHGARGIGLFRTEFLYLTRNDLPSEEEQYQVYKEAAKKLAPHPVIIRTFDLGGDKFIHGADKMDEMNPFLGWRSIRISLDREDIFRVQLRAILRASANGNVRIMFPMISCLEELRKAKEIMLEEKKRLLKQKVACDPHLKTGTMIEVPSAAIIAPHLAKECDFMSIGTNDLVQYTIAVDRGNEKIADLFEELHPSVLSFINMIIEAGHAENIPVGICGEMASDPASFLVLLGMGVDEFSMSPVIIPEMKRILTSVTFQEVYYVVEKILQMKTTQEIKVCILEELKDKFTMLPYQYAETLLKRGHYSD